MGFEASDEEQHADEEAADKVALDDCSCSGNDRRMNYKPNDLPIFLTRGLGIRKIRFSDHDNNRSELNWDDTMRGSSANGLPSDGKAAMSMLTQAMSKMVLRCQSLNADPEETGSGRLSIVNDILGCTVPLYA